MLESRLVSEFAETLSREFLVDREVASGAVKALLPPVACGFRRSLLTELPGSDELLGALSRILGEEHIVVGPIPIPAAKGNMILGEIFGFKDLSRLVALNAARISGLDRQLLQRMLPVIAVLVARRLLDVYHAMIQIRRHGVLWRLMHGSTSDAGEFDTILLREPILNPDHRWSWLGNVIERLSHSELDSWQ